ERLLWLSMVKYRLSTLGMSCNWPRVMSPWPGRSTLITSAPNQASSCVQVGPDCTCVKSRIFMPSSALPSWPQGFFEIFGALATSFSAGFLAALALSLRLAFFSFLSFFFAIVVPLFLLDLALRIEIADAAAFAARSRIDHRVDESRLAGVHRRVDGALQLIGRGGVDTGAAERLDHLVVARALDEHRRRRVVTGLVDVGAAIDAVVVENDNADREVVAADRLDLHA